MSVNKVTLLGRLGADPEVRTTTGGLVGTLRVATNSAWTDKNGKKQEVTQWHRVVVWAKLAEVASKYLKKGRELYLEGRLQTREWQDPQGQKRYATEIVATNLQLIGGKPDEVPATASELEPAGALPAELESELAKF